MDRVSYKDFNIAGFDTVTREYEGTEFSIRRTVGLDEIHNIVWKTTASCFVGENGDYTPEFKDFAFRREIIKEYTNIDMPDDAYEQCIFVYDTDIYRTIYSNINLAQFNAIKAATDELISFILQTNISAVISKLSELGVQIESFTEKMQGSMEGIDASAIENMINAFSNNGIDEVKLARAIMKKKK